MSQFDSAALAEPVLGPTETSIGIGMLGFGTVGTGTYRMLRDNREAIRKKAGVDVSLVRVGIRDAAKERAIGRDLLTTDLTAVVDDPRVSIVVELMGGVSPAGELIERALRQGKHVVTANKELLAKSGPRLINLAAREGLDLHFEAAVGGGIPLIQPLRHQLSGNDVLKMMGILNGTTNYVLTRMTDEGLDLGDALREAQSKGYAEADPTADVDGFDAQYKLAILASIAFGKAVPVEGVYREGIQKIARRDIHFAQVLGYKIKLVGVVEALEDGGILARVHPTMLPRNHPLASVDDVYNALWLRGDFVGDVMLSGRGAGADPTGSAVVGDIMDVCRNIRYGGAGNSVPLDEGIATAPIEKCRTRYYVRMVIQDRPKALGCIATVFGNCNVSLAAMEMRGVDSRLGEIVFLTHVSSEASIQRALKAMRNIHIVEQIGNVIRVEH
ncbi:MAG: homoserine dehydrogenase [Fimbriimonadaceae bacterium]|nr:homoserine dehydrogenase [Fimbriimonadaceae bacterium]